MNDSMAKRLEKYTIERPQEVLLVKVEIGEEEETIAIYRGFSSSLTKATASDPEVPIISEEAKIIAIDRVASPYIPDKPAYIERGLTRQEIENLLLEMGI